MEPFLQDNRLDMVLKGVNIHIDAQFIVGEHFYQNIHLAQLDNGNVELDDFPLFEDNLLVRLIMDA